MKALGCALLLTVAPMVATAMSETDYARTLAQHIRSHWKPPRNLSSDQACLLRLEITRTGSAENIDVSQCKRLDIQSSALRAVAKATPMPLPDASLDFDKVKKVSILLRP